MMTATATAPVPARHAAPRTDPHRPSALIPGDYDYVLSYSLASTFERMPIPAYGVNCPGSADNHAPDGRCCVVGLRRAGVKWAATGTTGKCSVCGASYIHGDVWRHRPTGEHIHIGYICAERCEMLADRSAYELGMNRLRQATLHAMRRNERQERIVQFLDAHPGLEADLNENHPILRDMNAKLDRWGSLSDRQIAFARKLARDVRNPEAHVDAPEGRGVTFSGVVVSVKLVAGFGYNAPATTKMVVKVAATGGSWLVYVTAPAAVLDAINGSPLKGATVTVTADLERSPNKRHFAFGKRPRAARLDAPAPTEAAS
jgi:hypothetical protein